jgi:hypothetical protein
VSRALRALAFSRAEVISLFQRLVEAAARRAADDAWCQANAFAGRPDVFHFPLSLVRGGGRVTNRVIAERDATERRVFILQLLEIRPL